MLGPLAASLSLHLYESKFSLSVPGSKLRRNLWRGLSLIKKDTYLHYVLVLSTLYEVTLTVLDYFLKLVSIRKFTGVAGLSVSNLTTFLGGYAVFINLLSFLFR